MERPGMFDNFSEVRVDETQTPYSMGSYTDCGSTIVCELFQEDYDVKKVVRQEILLNKDDPRLTLERIRGFPSGLVVCYENTAEVSGGMLESAEILTGYSFYASL